MPTLVTYQASKLVIKNPKLVYFNNLGNGLRFFYADSNRISLADNANLNLQPSSDFSITGQFVFYTSGDTQFIINKQRASGSGGSLQIFGWSVHMSSTFIGFYLWNGLVANRIYVTWTFTTPLQDGNLVHFTISKSGTGAGNIACKINNVLNTAKTIGTDNLSAGTIDYTGTFTEIGNQTGDSSNRFFPLNSLIYNLKISNRVVADLENTKLIKSDNKRFRELLGANTILDLGFDGNSGTFLQDASGNNVHGSLINFVYTALNENNQWRDKNGESILALPTSGEFTGNNYTGSTLIS